MPVDEKHTKRSLVLLVRRARCAAVFAGLHPRIVKNVAELQISMAQASRDVVWISYSRHLTDALVRNAARAPASLGVGLFFHSVDIRSIPALSSLFRRIAFNVDGGFMREEELAEVLQSENRPNLFIGGFANKANRTVTFWRGNLESMTLPFSAFDTSGDGTEPDFDDLCITDGGQTVKLGSYEAAVDAILYEYDPEVRRELSKRRLQEDRSFGAALRRLRKQRGLRREDFEPDVAAKTVARIEQGRVHRVQKATLAALAKHLAVDPLEIASF